MPSTNPVNKCPIKTRDFYRHSFMHADWVDYRMLMVIVAVIKEDCCQIKHSVGSVDDSRKSKIIEMSSRDRIASVFRIIHAYNFVIMKI